MNKSVSHKFIDDDNIVKSCFDAVDNTIRVYYF